MMYSVQLEAWLSQLRALIGVGHLDPIQIVALVAFVVAGFTRSMVAVAGAFGMGLLAFRAATSEIDEVALSCGYVLSAVMFAAGGLQWRKVTRRLRGFEERLHAAELRLAARDQRDLVASVKLLPAKKNHPVENRMEAAE